MTVTTNGLTKAAAVAAVVAGAIFIAVQINHPPMAVASVETTEWVVRSTAKVIMAALALAGIAGMYLRQHRQAGVLGLIGYLLFTIGYLAMFSVEVISASVLPALTGTDPGYVRDVLVTAGGGTPIGDIGAVQTLLNVMGLGFIVGGLLFGIALVRTRILARWAAILLAVGATATATLAVLPEAFNRPMAVPVGVALIGLGVSLWRDQHRNRLSDVATSAGSRPIPEPAT